MIMKMDEISHLAIENFKEGRTIWITANGWSMTPFLRHLRDSVELEEPNENNLRPLEIVLVKEDGWKLHRLGWFKDGYCRTMGDGCTQWDKIVPVGQVLAVVKTIRRKEKLISVHNMTYRLLVRIWWLLRPLRGYIFRALQHKLVRKLRKR